MINVVKIKGRFPEESALKLCIINWIDLLLNTITYKESID